MTTATDNSGIKISGTGGLLSATTIPDENDKFTIEIKPEAGQTLNIERTLPAVLTTVMDLR
jgi:archaellin